MFFRLAAAGAKLLALAALAGFLCFSPLGCSRVPRPPVERLAIPPFENLSDDASLDWLGRALSETVAAQTTGSSKVHPLRLASARDAARAGATGILRGYFTVADGRIRLKGSHEDLGSGRIAWTFDLVDSSADGLLRLADALARRIEPRAQPYETGKIGALEALVQGRAAGDPREAVAAFERAIAADPDFGAAYVALSGLLLSRGEEAGARSVVERARARGKRIAEIQRVEIDLLSATLEKDAAGRQWALAALGRLTPADADLFRQLAREESAAHRYAAAARWYHRVASLDPLNVLAWNQLGYVEAFNRNLEGARAALLEYQRLAPKEANPSDSLGDIHFYLGAFGDAERFYLRAYEKDASFLRGADLYKAARARLMTGDISGADQIFRRYAEARKAAQDPSEGYCEAQWLRLTGRKRQAVSRMGLLAACAGGLSEVCSLAGSQLAAWSLEEGNRDQAREWAARAAAAARSPSTRSLAALCRFLAEPPALGSVSEGGVNKLAQAYALLQAKRFAEAVPLLSGLVAETDPGAPEQINILLGWALVESGRLREAAPHLETYGTPPLGYDGPFIHLTFPRIFLLKALVLEKQGRLREADQMRGVYKKLSGPTDAR